MKTDILAFGAHPDDVELCCGATVAKMVGQGKTVVVVDLTRGELGSRGTPELRLQEAQASAEILGLAGRENLRLADGFFQQTPHTLLKVIAAIRHYRPEIVLANSLEDRHPDHARAAKLVRDAAFMSGLRKIETQRNHQNQEPWRPKRVFFYIQDHALTPDFVVSVTEEQVDKKLQAMRAYGSQFFNPEDKLADPQTYISSQEFWQFVEARLRNTGHMVGSEFGEGFQTETPLHIDNLIDLS
ncbi:MAG: bacillithiol biosynthesis deacetylase BshB1 [Bacteroidota bacterium]